MTTLIKEKTEGIGGKGRKYEKWTPKNHSEGLFDGHRFRNLISDGDPLRFVSGWVTGRKFSVIVKPFP